MEIKDKVIIITGASTGIGLAAARHLSKLGANVVLASRTIDSVKADGLKIKTDMRKKEDVIKLVKKTIEKYGRVDILINNAGQGMIGNLERIDIDDYRSIMELNVFSVVLAMQEVIPYMKKQGGGMIVNISSRVSKNYYPELSAYSSTKYALNALSMISREELKPDNIIVSLVHPKMTATDFMKNVLGKHDWGTGRNMPDMDTPGLVAEKIEQAIRTEEAEISL